MKEVNEGSIYLIRQGGRQVWAKLVEVEIYNPPALRYDLSIGRKKGRRIMHYVCISLATNRRIVLRSKARFIRVALTPADFAQIHQTTTDKAVHLLQGVI